MSKSSILCITVYYFMCNRSWGCGNEEGISVQAYKAFVPLQAHFAERMYKTFYIGREGGEKGKEKEKRKGKNITTKTEES